MDMSTFSHLPLSVDPAAAITATVCPTDPQARLRRRFGAGGGAGLPDHEILELILQRALPHDDVRELAGRLLDRFGSFAAVLSAPDLLPCRDADLCEAVRTELRIVTVAAQRLAQTRIRGRHMITSWQALVDYCRTLMAHRDTEQFRVFFLDPKNGLIADELLSSGTVDHVPVYPREIIRRALHHNATALILVHNHPSGDPTPSAADIEMTKQVKRAGDTMGIVLHDHLIIGAGGETSLRSCGLL